MKVTELNPEIFAEFVQSPAALIDFYATWCGPCRNMLRELDKFAEDHPEIKVGKINIEDENNQQLVARYDVSTIPSIYLFVNGSPVKHLSGFFPARVLAEKLGPL